MQCPAYNSDWFEPPRRDSEKLYLTRWQHCQFGMSWCTWLAKAHTWLCATALCGASLWIPRVGSWLKRTCPPCLEPLASSLLEQASRCCVTQVRLTVSDKWLNMQWKKPAELCVHTVWKCVCPPSLSAASLWYQTKDTDCWYFMAIFYS